MSSATADAALHAAASKIATFQGRETMRAIDEGDIRALLESTRAAYPGRHPFEPLLTADSVEEAIYGPSEAQEAAAHTDGRGVAISPESIRRQATNAGETGQLGEEVFERWLVGTGHAETQFEWVSKTHGRAAFDFEISAPQWEAGTLYIDVKATRGSHDSTFHMSAAELRWAARQPGYRIARVSSLTATSAEVRILANVSELATSILRGLEATLPRGVKVDSVEIPPAMLREVHRARVGWAAED